MKLFIKKLLLLTTGLFISANASATEFTIDNCTYTVISEEEKTVGLNALNYSSNTAIDLVIPETVIYNENTYTIVKLKNYSSIFWRGNNITSVSIPKTVTQIDFLWFTPIDGCTKITVADDNPNYCSIDGVLYNKDVTELIAFPDSKTSVSIPNTVTTIGHYAFYNTKLTSISIPNSVTRIGNSAFDYCENLTSISIPNSVTIIELNAFHYLKNLTEFYVSSQNQNYSSIDGVLYNKDATELICCPIGKKSVTIPNSVTIIGDYAFCYTQINSIVIPNSVTTIGIYAFEISQISSIIIPNSVTTIGYGAFFYSKLTSITIPESVTSIGISAFYSGTMSEIIVDENNQNYCSIDGVLYNKDVTELIYTPCAKKDISIPNTVMTIGDRAFYHSQINSIVIPNSVTEIKANAFTYSSYIDKIYCQSINPPVCNNPNSTFSPSTLTGNNTTLYVPVGSRILYEGTAPWGDFTNIVETDFSELSNQLQVEDKIMYIGHQEQLPIGMTNDQQITAIQADLYLPTGVSVAKDEYDEYMISLSDRATSSHMVSYAPQADGAVRIIVMSMDNEPFIGDAGNLLNVTLEVSEEATLGENEFTLANINLVRPNATEIYPNPVVGKLDIRNYLKGDSNVDGKISLGDAVNSVNYIIGANPENFVFFAADINEDNEVNITDVVGITNILLYGNVTAPQTASIATASVSAMETAETAGYSMNISDFTIKAGETKTLYINMTNATNITAFQTDIKLPDGLSIINKASGDADVSLTARKTSSHSVKSGYQEDGSLRIASFSSMSKSFRENSGALIEIQVKANDDLIPGTYTIEINNTIMTEASLTEHKPADYTYKFSNEVTGIETLITGNETTIIPGIGNFTVISPCRQEITVYDIAGRLINQITVNAGESKYDIEAGIYIINNKKIAIK